MIMIKTKKEITEASCQLLIVCLLAIRRFTILLHTLAAIESENPGQVDSSLQCDPIPRPPSRPAKRRAGRGRHAVETDIS